MPCHGRLASGKYRRRRSLSCKSSGRSQLVGLRMALFGLARRIVLRRSFAFITISIQDTSEYRRRRHVK